jgi:hypothetical protein
MDNKNIKKTLKLLTLYEYDILGSAGDPNVKYKSDVDAQEIINLSIDDNKDYNDIYKFFKDLFIKIKKSKNIYITDFKCGHCNNTLPIRWEYDDIMKGYVETDGEKKDFITALNQKSIIKIDIILLDEDDKLYKDISVNYYFNYINEDKKIEFSTNLNSTDKDYIIISLKEDIEQFKKEENYYKMLKRMYSLYKIENKPTHKLLKIINSKYGKLNSFINQLNIINDIIELSKLNKPNINDIKYNINYVYNNIDPSYKKYFKQLLKAKQLKSINNKLKILIEKLNNKLNNKLKKKLIN